MGTNVRTHGEIQSNPVTHGKFNVSVSGNVKLGGGLGANIDIGKANISANADLGSIRIVEGQIGTEESSASFVGERSGTQERGAGINIGVLKNKARVGVAYKQVQKIKDGKVVSDNVSKFAGAKVGNKVYGISEGNVIQNQKSIKTHSFDVGVGLQMILGFDVKLKVELKTSTNKKDLE